MFTILLYYLIKVMVNLFTDFDIYENAAPQIPNRHKTNTYYDTSVLLELFIQNFQNLK